MAGIMAGKAIALALKTGDSSKLVNYEKMWKDTTQDELVNKYKEGSDVVHSIRKKRYGESFLKIFITGTLGRKS